jgi:hypothetical protein
MMTPEERAIKIARIATLWKGLPAEQRWCVACKIQNGTQTELCAACRNRSAGTHLERIRK